MTSEGRERQQRGDVTFDHEEVQRDEEEDKNSRKWDVVNLLTELQFMYL